MSYSQRQPGSLCQARCPQIDIFAPTSDPESFDDQRSGPEDCGQPLPSNTVPTTPQYINATTYDASIHRSTPSKSALPQKSPTTDDVLQPFHSTNSAAAQEVHFSFASEGEDSDSAYSPEAHITTDDSELSETGSQSGNQSPIVSEEEIQQLHSERFGNDLQTAALPNSSNSLNARQIVIQDVWSSLFNGGVDTLLDNSIDSMNSSDQYEESNAVSDDENRGNVEGLEDWTYASPFQSFKIDIDGINQSLGNRLLSEANHILQRVTREVEEQMGVRNLITQTNLTRLSILDVFLPEHVFLKVVSNLNRVLKQRNQKPTTPMEFKGISILHVLAASYSSSVSTITSKRNKDFFFQMGISSGRYAEIWSSLSFTVGRRQRVECDGDRWCNFPQRANAMITELEHELAAVNRLLLYVPGVTIFSLDDDHQRLRSRVVAQLTMMSHVNNPQKALGPVNNAMCSALNPLFLASHYSRPGEKIIDVWERLVRLIQGVPTAGLVRPMTDAMFASDRGYNGKSTVDYITNRIGATGIGTYKQSLDYPFVFGHGAIRKRHKGVVVSEVGCRAIYSAKRKTKTLTGRTVEAIVYRESVSGRIAAVYHNNERLFSADQFTLIPKAGYEGMRTEVDRELFHLVYDSSVSEKGTQASTTGFVGTTSIPRMKVMQALSGSVEITLLQSEDPGWFLSRAFQFTSRTSHSFLRALADNHEDNLEALSSLICGKRIDHRPVTFPTEMNGAKQSLMSKLIIMSHSLNMKLNSRPAFDQRQQAVSL